MAEPVGAVGEQQATPDTPVAPARSQERIASLDLIRGIAVLGILVPNIIAFGQPFSAYLWPSAFLTEHGEVSNWMWIAQFVLVDGKMRGLFTLLFGAGMALFMDKAWERGATRWLQARRLFWLLVFGLLHFYFLFRGDVLVLYSVAGFFGLLFLRKTPLSLMVTGCLLYAFGALAYTVTIGSAHFIADTPMGEAPGMEETRASLEASKQTVLDDGNVEIALMREGSYFEILDHTFSEHLTQPLNMLYIFALETFPLMLIGMAIYRYGWFSASASSGRRKIWGWSLLLLGTALSVPIALWVRAEGFTYWHTLSALTAFSMIPRLLMILGLVMLLAIYGQRASGWLAERLSFAGRAAFTNYIGTSVLMMLIFHPWAGGKWGEFTRPELYFVVLFAWAVMLAWSKPWLERYRYGPLEWLWRCLTYGRLFPLKR